MAGDDEIESVRRLRLLFEDEKMLQKSQRKSGLNRSWVSLKPCHTTISDVVVYLMDAFQLQHTCREGLILSMDGFVLPPFESTSIFRDNDIINVKRKGKSHALIKQYGEVNSLEKLALAEKQPVNTDLKLLANEEFQKETGGYESESEDNEADKLEDKLRRGNTAPDINGSKKRKASKEPKRLKKKKNKHSSVEEGLALPVDKDCCHQEENEIVNGDDDNISAKEKNKNICNDIMPSNLHQALEKSSNSDTQEDSDHSSEPSPGSKRLSLPQENLKSIEDASHTPDGIKKGPSRSARRKKSKRRWLREMAKINKIEPQQRQLFTDNQLSSGKKASRATEEGPQQVCKDFFSKKESHQSQIHKDDSKRLPASCNAKFPDQVQQPDYDNNEEDDDTVPVVICPGHIRFESREKGQSPDQNQVSNENIQWNGITSKKKGLKWGTMKAASSRKTECANFNEGTSEELTNEQSTNTKSHIDFNKLPPCATLPKEGDIIAYRLIELSSTWTPELSSYRVGQVTQFNVGTKRITLKPVPEFPIDFGMKVDEEGSLVQPDTSLYGDDGSLVIGFSSLIEVRIVKSGHANAEAVNKPLGHQNTSSGHEKGNGWADKGGNSSTCDVQALCKEKAHSEVKGWGERSHASSTDGKVNAWEEISRTLNAKKAQLSQKDNWSQKEDSGKRSWSYKALRGSALGPTMAILREQNQL